MKMFIYVCFVRLYTSDLYSNGYLCIVYFSLSCKALGDSEIARKVPYYYYYFSQTKQNSEHLFASRLFPGQLCQLFSPTSLTAKSSH